MAHNVESMMYAGEVPWHKLGNAVPANLSWQDAIQAAGLDWTVTTRRMFVRSLLDRPGERTAIEVPGAKAVVRESDGAVLGSVGERYATVQNREAFETFGQFFGDAAVLNTAGSLHGGRVVWGLAESPEPFIVGNDTHRKFLLVTNSHDGSGALRVYPTAVRVVCANTLAASRRDAGAGIAVRHTGNPTARLREKTRVLKQAFGFFDDYARKGAALLDRILTRDESRDIVAELVNAETARGRSALESILYLAEHGAGNAPYRGTAYALLQGVTDYVDHARMPSQAGDKRFSSVLLGSGAAMKAQALDVILERTGGAPKGEGPQAPAGGLLDDMFSTSIPLAD
jgi:phage/plasmid-like protein (TIGR03299 family)